MYKIAISVNGIWRPGIFRDVGVVFDTDAQAWIDRMTSPTPTQQTAINNLVVAEKLDGNFALWKYAILLNLGATNSLIDQGGITATVTGGVTFDGDGALGDGSTGFIDIGASPSGLVVQNDAFVSHFIKDYSGDHSGTQASFGSTVTSSRRISYLENGATEVFLQVNSSFGSETVSASFPNETLVSGLRVNSSEHKCYFGGSVEFTQTETSTVISGNNIYLFANNNAGTANFFCDITLSSFVVADGVGFDVDKHNTNMRAYMTELGTI